MLRGLGFKGFRGLGLGFRGLGALCLGLQGLGSRAGPSNVVG